ncbi:unnamed protein product [Cylicostephanus goldi]|uniref:rRNA biogenesis protein RRP36 n=1 Tax=Cylicostephanus goldi TaxID=71465 RepID=A0A3P6QZG5_CYLGO|nr:unnamed protein product [Cylicostephanus goldi]
MLGGSEDEMYASDDDVVDITDMLEDGDDTATVCYITILKSMTRKKMKKQLLQIFVLVLFRLVLMKKNTLANVIADLADLPLGKVREMKEKLGLKLFNKAYFGATEATKKAEESRKKKLEAKKFHGQHRPKEISSKRPVSAFRPIYQENVGKKKRDPRFDNRAGLFKERCFDDNYRFLEDLKRQEKEVCNEAVACEERGDSETAEKIRETIRRMENRERTKAERKMKEETLRELREANIERMMHGERPVFKTKAQVKMMNLEKKFKQLKKDNKLDKYMKRKAKKEAHKDMKKKPSFEEMYGYQ